MYVVNSSKLLREKINKDMLLLVSKILSQFESVKSIFLVGGFGRDEGSVLNYEDKFQPINDYDLVVIGNRWIKGSNKDFFRKELAELCKIRQIDIVLIHPNKLSSLRYTMFNYDLKYASKLIYGSNNFLHKIPSWNVKNMPLKEAIAPLFLFLSSILQAYPASNNLNDEGIFWSFQQLTKSILGWSSAMLIFEGLYHPSYVHRKKIFHEKFSHENDLCRLVEIATNFKINPQINICNQKELSDFWLEASSTHLKVLKILLTRYYKINNFTWDKIALSHRLSYINMAKTIYSILFNNPHYRNCLNTDIAKLYLCIGLNERKSSYINKSKNYYQKLIIKNISPSSFMSDEQYLDSLMKADINAQIFYANDNKVFYE